VQLKDYHGEVELLLLNEERECCWKKYSLEDEAIRK
jgi:hypothetical protein